MKHCNRLLAAWILSTTLFTVCAMSADERQAPPPSKSPASDVSAAWKRRVPSLEIDNLPLSEVALMLRKQFPEVNFIVPENARDATVHLTLRSAALDEILKAIELASEGRIRANYQKDQPDNLVGFMVARAPVRQTPVICRVFSLASYLEGRNENDADRAIAQLYQVLEVAWEMTKKYERDVQAPSLHIHGGTKLLIAVGREKELAVIEQVIRELQGSVSSTTIPTPSEDQNKPKASRQSPGAPAKLF